MNTLNDPLAAVTPAPAEPEPTFPEEAARRAAAVLFAQGDTAEDVREFAAGRPEALYMWSAIAAQMDVPRGEGCAR